MSAIQNWRENNKPSCSEFYQTIIDRLQKNKLPYTQGITPYKPNEAPFLLFRGESKKYDKPNLNALGREEFTKDQEIDYTEAVFKSIYHLSDPFKSDLNIQFLAFIQHLRFKTRLLDYSSDETTALWFAVNDDEEKAGYLHIACGFNILAFLDKFDYADIESTIYGQDLIKIDRLGVLWDNPCLFYQDNNIYNLRAKRQKGWFLLQPWGTKGNDKYIHTYEISPEYKKAIREEIEKNRGNPQAKILQAKDGKNRYQDFLMANPDYIKEEFDAIQWSPQKFYLKNKEQVIQTYLRISEKLGLTGQEEDSEFLEKLKSKGLEDSDIRRMMTLRNTNRLNELYEHNSVREDILDFLRTLGANML